MSFEKASEYVQENQIEILGWFAMASSMVVVFATLYAFYVFKKEGGFKNLSEEVYQATKKIIEEEERRRKESNE